MGPKNMDKFKNRMDNAGISSRKELEKRRENVHSFNKLSRKELEERRENVHSFNKLSRKELEERRENVHSFNKLSRKELEERRENVHSFNKLSRKELEERRENVHSFNKLSRKKSEIFNKLSRKKSEIFNKLSGKKSEKIRETVPKSKVFFERDVESPTIKKQLKRIQELSKKDIESLKEGSKMLEINTSRLAYLCELFGFKSKSKLIEKINESKSRKTPYTQEDIFGTGKYHKVTKTLLAEIDKIFNKGFTYYQSIIDPPRNSKNSIFLRKTQFNVVKLELGDKQLISKIEDDINYLKGLMYLSNHKIKRKVKKYRLQSSNATVAGFEFHKSIFPKAYFDTERDFLKTLCANIEKQGAIIFEHIESPNKKDKTSVEGFFIKPYTICIKRNRGTLGSFKREIFTLAHEFGHFLIDTEEVDDAIILSSKLSTVEKWCNQFAFSFLTGEEKYKQLRRIKSSEINLENAEIEQISKTTHLSRDAIFYFFLQEKIISADKYKTLKKELEREHEKAVAAYKKHQIIISESDKKKIFFALPKPILSNTEKKIYAEAFLEGAIDEHSVFRRYSSDEFAELVYG